MNVNPGGVDQVDTTQGSRQDFLVQNFEQDHQSKIEHIPIKCCSRITDCFKSIGNFFQKNKKIDSQVSVVMQAPEQRGTPETTTSMCPSTSNFALDSKIIAAYQSRKSNEINSMPKSVTILKAVLDEISSGILPEHLQAIIKTAQETETIIAIRPVSKYAKPWIEKGYPTKPFALKKKTSREGIGAGLIKEVVVDQEVVVNIREDGKKTIARPDFFLFKSEMIKNFVENFQEFYVEKLYLFNKNNKQVKKIRDANKIVCQLAIYSMDQASSSNSSIFEVLKKEDEESWRLFSCTFNNEKIENEKEVYFWRYADKHSLPFTSDYDLLTVGFDEKLRNDEHYQSLIKMSNSSEIKSVRASLDIYLTLEHPMKGNVSPFLENIIRILNKNIKNAYADGRSAFHHNIEARNPLASSDAHALFPALFAIPNFPKNTLDDINNELIKKNIKPIQENIFICSNWSDLKGLIDSLTLSDSGFNLKLNSDWPVKKQ